MTDHAMPATNEAKPAAPALGTYYAVAVPALPGRWEVLSWQQDEGAQPEWVFLQGFDGERAEADARELAAYMNAGGV